MEVAWTLAGVNTAQKPTVTGHTEVRMDRKMALNWPENWSPGEFGTALRSIFKMLRNAMPNSPGERF